MVFPSTAIDLAPAVEYSILVFFYHRSATHCLTSPTICLCILSSNHMSIGAKFYDDSESVILFQIGPTFLEISRKKRERSRPLWSNTAAQSLNWFDYTVLFRPFSRYPAKMGKKTDNMV